MQSLIVYALGQDYHLFRDPSPVEKSAGGKTQKFGAISGFLVRHSINLGEGFDLVCSIVIPLAYTVDMKQTFAELPMASFNALFPICFCVATVLSQLCMGSDFLYSLPALNACIPREDKPIYYEALPMEDMEAKNQLEMRNPVVVDGEDGDETPESND